MSGPNRKLDRNDRYFRLPSAGSPVRLPAAVAQGTQPRLEDWCLVAGDRLSGRVYDDPRFEDGEHITTSPVLLLSNHAAATRTTRYRLGRHA